LLYPSDFEQKLGFDQIREILADYCLSTLGRKQVGAISFCTNRDDIHSMLTQTAEMKQVLESEEHFPSQDYFDLIPELLRIRIDGTYMEAEQLSELKLSLSTIHALHTFLTTRKEQYPSLYNLLSSTLTRNPVFLPLTTIIQRIDSLIDEKSQIRDKASATLMGIRKEKATKQSLVERKVVQSFKLARKNGWTPDEAEITIRDGRLVIPLTSTHKRRIPGFIHDESATGQTIYLEPADIFETNQEIRELEYAERREIIRILVEFAAFLRPSIDDLIHDYSFLGQIDFLRAKAHFAIEIHGQWAVPGIKTDDDRQQPMASCQLDWHQALHPLLFLSHQKQKKTVVPLDIRLNEEERILIISGPNAGGKSVCLKTVGLLQYMYQCGLLPPAREDSVFPVFRNIFIDIGDEQSIDNDLSTYTGKLINLKYFIEHLDDHSLFLIDELGTGTDPSLGGPIAEATLECLNRKKSFGVVTTHYSNLKLLAGREPGIANGAMLYDSKKMRPLYRLKTGKPGSSFAFEIAREIGFPEEVLDNARKKTGKSQLDFDRELQNLEVERQHVQQHSTELNLADDLLAGLIQKYEKLMGDLEASRKEILEKARIDARQLIEQANKQIERTIKEIRESQADKARTREVREELKSMKEKLTGDPVTTVKPKHEPAPVRVKQEIPEKPVTHSPYQSYVDDLHRKLQSFVPILDLRGKRVDEALYLIQRYIDDATLLSIPEVRILHGKGFGTLRQVTRDYLRTVKEIKSYGDEQIDRGGSGITVVTFH